MARRGPPRHHAAGDPSEDVRLSGCIGGGPVAGIEVHRLKSLRMTELFSMLAGDSTRGGAGDRGLAALVEPGVRRTGPLPRPISDATTIPRCGYKRLRNSFPCAQSWSIVETARLSSGVGSGFPIRYRIALDVRARERKVV